MFREGHSALQAGDLLDMQIPSYYSELYTPPWLAIALREVLQGYI